MLLCRTPTDDASRDCWYAGGRAVTLVTVRKLGVTVFVAFMVLSFWSNPSGSAQTFADFLGDVGSFFSTIIEKIIEFVSALGN